MKELTRSSRPDHVTQPRCEISVLPSDANRDIPASHSGLHLDETEVLACAIAEMPVSGLFNFCLSL